MRRFPGVAAAVFACAVGCGKTTALSDAPGAIDGSSIDANTTVDAIPVGDVTVTTHSRCCTEPNGTLEANVPVFSVQPGGAAGPMGMTDATGKVTLTGVQAGASITAVYTIPTGYQIVTVLGVEPGDNLVLGDAYTPSPATTGTGALTVSFPSVTGANRYDLYTPCGQDFSSAEGLPFNVTESCVVPSPNLVLTTTDTNGAVIAAGVVKNAPWTDGQTAALAAWTSSAADNFTASISGLAAAVTSVNFGATMVVDGNPYTPSASIGVTPASGAASGTMDVPGAGDRTYAYAQLYRTGQVGRQETYLRGAGDATSATFTAPTLPWLGQIIVNAAAHVATWIPVGTGAYDTAVVFASWSHFDAVKQATVEFSWTIAVPPGVTQLAWTDPPAALAPYFPADTDLVRASMQLVDLSSATSYDQVRAAPEWQWTAPDHATETGELPSGSSVAFDGVEGQPLARRRGRAPHGPVSPPHARATAER